MNARNLLLLDVFVLIKKINNKNLKNLIFFKNYKIKIKLRLPAMNARSLLLLVLEVRTLLPRSYITLPKFSILYNALY